MAVHPAVRHACCSAECPQPSTLPGPDAHCLEAQARMAQQQAGKAAAAAPGAKPSADKLVYSAHMRYLGNVDPYL
eukprot:343015-Pelagomonas_calceolata.AAC.1